MTRGVPLDVWLATCEHVSDVQPCTVKIGRTKYQAARYAWRQTRTVGRSEDRLYVLGARPPSHKRTSRLAYTIDGEDWYLACWAAPEVTNSPEFAQFHPYGPWFGLHRWDADEPIDRYEPHERMKVEVK